jgi:hypothetical protein
MIEEWRAIPGFEGAYEVSSLGRVRSLDRVVVQLNRGGTYAPRLLKGRILAAKRNSAKDYPRADLCVDGRYYHRHVHVLVLSAFVGPCPDGMQGCHNDGNPKNNVVSNLRWDTPASNSADRQKHGTQTRGEAHGTAKLVTDEVVAIRRAVLGGALQRVVGEIYGISQSHVSELVHRKCWGHVE